MNWWKRIVLIWVFAWLALYPAGGQTAPVVDNFAIHEKMIALTVEDIESAADMREILTLSRKQEVKMTFFLSAKFLIANTDLMKQAIAEGHEFGNHGVHHRYWGETDTAGIKQELAEAADMLQQATDRTTILFMPPYNYYEAAFIDAVNQLSPQAIIVRGTDMADWTLMKLEAVVEKAVSGTSNGAIMHFNWKVKTAATALPDVIAELKNQGYKLVTVSELKAKLPSPALPKQRRSLKPAYYGVLDHIEVSQPAVALTFDDGGSPYKVNAILDTLKMYQAKATFFLLGNWVNENPDLVRRMAAEGHQIANHSQSHPRFTWLSQEQMKREIDATQTAIAEAAGQPAAPYFRPPYGSYNGKVLNVIREMGYEALVMWDIDTRDWTSIPADAITGHVLGHVSAGNIILFHLHAAHTAEALADLIPALQSRGYKFSTIGDMLQE
jgi:peptidoglycan/xylan/chitin deacetylase (PgdA/CDA1 family)